VRAAVPKKFQLKVVEDTFRWIEVESPYGTLQFEDAAGDQFYDTDRVYRVAMVGRGSTIAYYLTALAPRAQYEDQFSAAALIQTKALHRSMAIFGKVDPWSKAVRGDGYINHEEHLVGHWGKGVAKFSADYMRRNAFVAQNKQAFQEAASLGATFIESDVISITQRGDVYQIFTQDYESYYAAFVVTAMGLGPHRGLHAGKGTPQLELPNGATRVDQLVMQYRLAPSVMDLDRFMREYPERGGIESDVKTRLEPTPSKLTVLVHGANAGIDAVQRAWQLGHEIDWLCPADPIFLKGNRLPIADEQVADVKRHPLKAETEVLVKPTDDGKVRVTWTDSSGGIVAKEVDLYVIAVGQDPFAEGAVGDVLFTRGGIKKDKLSMIWDFDQVFGLPFQTILGYQVLGRRKGFGLQIIGAACEVLTRELSKFYDPPALLADFKSQLTPLEREPTKEHTDRQIDESPALTEKWGTLEGRATYYQEKLKNWKRAVAMRERFEKLAEAYLGGMVDKRGTLMPLLTHQVDPTKIPANLAQIVEAFRDAPFLVGQLATKEWPGTTAGASVLLPSQLGSVRAVTAALAAFIPEYVLNNDANFATDDRNMLAVHLAQSFPGFTPIEADARVAATISLRRSDTSPLGFHDDQLRKTIQERWANEQKKL
jgi:hypothetical protein